MLPSILGYGGGGCRPRAMLLKYRLKGATSMTSSKINSCTRPSWTRWSSISILHGGILSWHSDLPATWLLCSKRRRHLRPIPSEDNDHQDAGKGFSQHISSDFIRSGIELCRFSLQYAWFSKSIQSRQVDILFKAGSVRADSSRWFCLLLHQGIVWFKAFANAPPHSILLKF
jgi:hypothetical protein